MRTDELIAILQEIQESGQILLSQETIRDQTKSRFVLVRALIAEVLIYYPRDFAIPLSLQLLSDKNSEVRSSAAIGLARCSELEVYLALKQKFLEDSSSIVRAYSGCSFINNDNFKNSFIPEVETILLREKSYFVRSMCYGELYKIQPNIRFLEGIIQCFASNIYQTRCAVLNVLNDILDCSNAEYIFYAIADILKKEKLEIIRESALMLQSKAKNKTWDGSLS